MLTVIKSVTESEKNLISNLANTCAIIQENKNYHWIGFYIVEGDELVLGPFQGPLACTRIPKGKGVCGTSWSEARTMRIDDVHKFEGHISCSALSNSELVVPIIKNEKVVAVLDIDSTEFSHFSEQDQNEFEAIGEYLSTLF